MFTLVSSTFARGDGGFGGPSGSGPAPHAIPGRKPDVTETLGTSRDQALLYRLNGDRNPLHSDPTFAKLAGFDKPILHGLCTFGFTGRALLHAVCNSDPTRFKSIEGRFSQPVMPGDTGARRIQPSAS